MQLPKKVRHQVIAAVERTDELRRGTAALDPRWLDCIGRVLAQTPRQDMRDFFEQYFVQSASYDDILFNLYIERSTLYNWRDYFLWNIALEAAEAGLLHLSA